MFFKNYEMAFPAMRLVLYWDFTADAISCTIYLLLFISPTARFNQFIRPKISQLQQTNAEKKQCYNFVHPEDITIYPVVQGELAEEYQEESYPLSMFGITKKSK